MVIKVTVARNQNSIRWKNGEKKTLGETMLSRGPLLIWPTNQQCMIMIQSELEVKIQFGL